VRQYDFAATNSRFRGSPGRQQRFVQGAPLIVSEVIAFIIGNQIDNRPLG